MMRLDFVPKDITEDHTVSSTIALHEIVLDPSVLQRTYGVTLFLGHDTPVKIQYKIDLTFLHETEEGSYIIEIQKQQMYINGKQPTAAIEILMDACGAVIYPLQVAVTKNFGLLDIVNHNSITQRWKRVKKELQQSFEGAYATSLLEETSKTISSTNAIERAVFSKDWFYVAFFNALRGRMIQQRFPMIPHQKGVLYQITNKACYHKRRIKDIVLTSQGICIDQRSEDEITKGNRLSDTSLLHATGTSHLTYQFFEGTHQIDAITGNIELTLPSEQKESVRIEIFNLKDEIPKTTDEKVEDDQKKLQKEVDQKKKKKRYFLFGKELKL